RDAVARIDLDAIRLQERRQRIDHEEALDLLGVAAGGRKEQHGSADLAPAHHIDFLAQALRIPLRVDLRHAVLWREDSSPGVHAVWPFAGGDAGAFGAAARRAAGVPAVFATGFFAARGAGVAAAPSLVLAAVLPAARAGAAPLEVAAALPAA